LQVILKENMVSLGQVGDIVEVKDGYGRNYLIPKEKAIKVNPRNIKLIEHAQKLLEVKINKDRAEAQEMSKKLEGQSLTIYRKSGEDDKLYGSVTAIDIQNGLKEKGLEIDRKKILLDSSIKNLGTFKVPIKVYSEMTVEIEINVAKA